VRVEARGRGRGQEQETAAAAVKGVSGQSLDPDDPDDDDVEDDGVEEEEGGGEGGEAEAAAERALLDAPVAWEDVLSGSFSYALPHDPPYFVQAGGKVPPLRCRHAGTHARTHARTQVGKHARTHASRQVAFHVHTLLYTTYDGTFPCSLAVYLCGFVTHAHVVSGGLLTHARARTQTRTHTHRGFEPVVRRAIPVVAPLGGEGAPSAALGVTVHYSFDPPDAPDIQTTHTTHTNGAQ
jgi:hypothetical protein